MCDKNMPGSNFVLVNLSKLTYGLYLYQIQSLHLGIPDREKKAVWIPAPAPYPPNPFFVHPKCERRLVATLDSFTLVPFFPPGD